MQASVLSSPRTRATSVNFPSSPFAKSMTWHNGVQSSSAYSSTGMLTPLGVGVAAGSSTMGTSSRTRTMAISSQPSRLGHLTQSDQTFSGSESFGTTSKPSFSKN